MSIVRRITFLIMPLYFLVTSVAASSPGTSIFSFLKICPAALNAGMGETYVTAAAPSAWENPAVLPWVGHPELTVSRIMYLSDISYSFLQYAHQIDMNTSIAGSLSYLGVPAMDRTVSDGSIAQYAEQGTFSSYDAAFSLSFGKRISRAFSYGVTVRGAQESIDSSSTAGAMLSLGGFYRPPRSDWQAGFGVTNIGPTVQGFDLPTGFFAGVAGVICAHVFWSSEVIGYMDQIVDLRTGVEYEINHTLFWRAGYKYPLKDYGLGEFPNINLTAGAGFQLNGMVLDYAWVPYGDMGNTHRLTLSVPFGPDVIHKRISEKRR
ncbi:MAG: PorV/PorQ family protein [Elusimicrobia bacterium]|nr:PorV/PorQ family protein [Elusimicrobiota bacterium]